MGKSFLSRVSPSKSRTKVIDWPFKVEGEETPKVRMSVLGADKLEAANLAAVDHFAKLLKEKKIAKPVAQTDPAFDVRERIELVFLAFEAKDGDEWAPIADTADEMAREANTVIVRLYQEWAQFQADVTARPTTPAQMEELIGALKKNIHGVPLYALSSSLLIELITTLVSQQEASTMASGVG